VTRFLRYRRCHGDPLAARRCATFLADRSGHRNLRFLVIAAENIAGQPPEPLAACAGLDTSDCGLRGNACLVASDLHTVDPLLNIEARLLGPRPHTHDRAGCFNQLGRLSAATENCPVTAM